MLRLSNYQALSHIIHTTHPTLHVPDTDGEAQEEHCSHTLHKGNWLYLSMHTDTHTNIRCRGQTYYNVQSHMSTHHNHTQRHHKQINGIRGLCSLWIMHRGPWWPKVKVFMWSWKPCALKQRTVVYFLPPPLLFCVSPSLCSDKGRAIPSSFRKRGARSIRRDDGCCGGGRGFGIKLGFEGVADVAWQLLLLFVCNQRSCLLICLCGAQWQKNNFTTVCFLQPGQMMSSLWLTTRGRVCRWWLWSWTPQGRTHGQPLKSV